MNFNHKPRYLHMNVTHSLSIRPLLLNESRLCFMTIRRELQFLAFVKEIQAQAMQDPL